MPSIFGISFQILFRVTNSSLTVEWFKVFLNQREDLGPFTFQSQLFANGNINFLYRRIPVSLASLTQDNLQGIGDSKLGSVYVGVNSYILLDDPDTTHFGHVWAPVNGITNGTGLFIKPRAMCEDLETCETCLNRQDNVCQWCSGECIRSGISEPCSESCEDQYYKVEAFIGDVDKTNKLWNIPTSWFMVMFSTHIQLRFEFPYFGTKIDSLMVYDTGYIKLQQYPYDIYHTINLGMMTTSAVSSYINIYTYLFEDVKSKGTEFSVPALKLLPLCRFGGMQGRVVNISGVYVRDQPRRSDRSLGNIFELFFSCLDRQQ
jgi:hypothetical protein